MLSDIEGMGPGWCMGETPLVHLRKVLVSQSLWSLPPPSSPSALPSVLQTARNVFIPMNKDKEML